MKRADRSEDYSEVLRLATSLTDRLYRREMFNSSAAEISPSLFRLRFSGRLITTLLML